MKMRDRMGEKAGIYTPTLPLTFGFSLSSAIKNVHLYAHQNTPNGTKNVCIHGGWKKRTKKKGKERGERGKEVEKMKMENEKGRQRERTKTLSSFCSAFCLSLLCFSLLFFCLSFGFKKMGKRKGKRGELPLLLLLSKNRGERWRKGNLKRGWRGGDCLFMEKKEN